MLGLGNRGDKERVVQHAEFGTITYRKRRGLRRLSITIKSAGEINVSMPFFVSYADAEKFVAEKTDWIRKSQNKLSKIKNTFFDENTEYHTRSYRLKILQHNENFVRRIVANGFLTIYYPHDADIHSPKLQAIFRQCVLDALSIEAKEYLPQRIYFLAQKFGFKFNQLHIKNNLSNYGSCSYNNNINLNLHLMRLPDELIDYVILHELCHTVVKNHGAQFWALLDSVTGNCARELSKRTKELNLRTI